MDCGARRETTTPEGTFIALVPRCRFRGPTLKFLIQFSEFRPNVCRTPAFVYALPTVWMILITSAAPLVPRHFGTFLSYQPRPVKTVSQTA